MASDLLSTSDSPYAALFPAVQRETDPEFDITAMVDLVFMMNIFFLVTFVTAALSEINLPTANHAVPLDGDKAIAITVLAGPDWKTVVVYLGDGKKVKRERRSSRPTTRRRILLISSSVRRREARMRC
jgi:hypothetical protein